MAETYILFSKKSNKFYVGSSRDSAKQRLEAHNKGKTRSTKFERPWVLLHVERYETYTEARKRELFLKTGVGRQWIKRLYGDAAFPERRGGRVV